MHVLTWEELEARKGEFIGGEFLRIVNRRVDCGTIADLSSTPHLGWLHSHDAASVTETVELDSHGETMIGSIYARESGFLLELADNSVLISPGPTTILKPKDHKDSFRVRNKKE